MKLGSYLELAYLRGAAKILPSPASIKAPLTTLLYARKICYIGAPVQVLQKSLLAQYCKKLQEI